jgi:CheY-like chemotaxis protein
VADRARLVQVFLKILINAAQAIGEGPADRNAIRATVRHETGSIAIEITDTGRGMPPHVLRRIFEPFFSTKAAGKGAGLGLFVCHEIVTALGGSIGVQSAEGRGTTFRVLLPDADADRTEPGTDRVSGVIRARRSGLLLVLDRDPAVGPVIRVATDRAVECYADPEYALKRIRAGIFYDLIFCNSVVGDMSAIEFHARLRDLPGEHGARVVFMVGENASDYARAQRIALLRKPIAVGEARALILARLGAESAARPA